MFLLIHPDLRDSHHLVFLDQNIKKEINSGDPTLLEAVDNLLLSEKLPRENLQGIGVVVGVGTFSTLRSAVVLANTWHFALRIPVVALTPEDWEDTPRVLAKFFQAKTNTYILPFYSAEPNIGKKIE